MCKRDLTAEVYPLHSGVTGSCFYVKVAFPDGKDYVFVVDCGLFQEKDYNDLNEQGFPFSPASINAVLLTHNHVDHSGRLPDLVKGRFRGPIYTTEPTSGMLQYALLDSQKIMEMNVRKKAELLRKKLKLSERIKREKVYPRYTVGDVNKTIDRIEPCEYNKRIKIHPNIYVTFLHNGHIYGSAMILVEIQWNHPRKQPINFLFTGDYKSNNPFFKVKPLLQRVRKMPLHVISEATYGADDRADNRESVFMENIILALSKGKQILIPTFALERGQLVMAKIREMQNRGLISPNIPIYGDGRLLQQYTGYYKHSAQNDFFRHMQDIIPQNFRWVDRNTDRVGMVEDGVVKIIITTSGMGCYGPTQVYIPNFLHMQNSTIHFTGYLCEGTTGRNILEASRNGGIVEAYGQITRVECSVAHTSEFSSHGSAREIIGLISKFQHMRTISFNHGEMQAKTDMAKRVIQEGIAKTATVMQSERAYRYDAYGLVKVIDLS